MNFIHIGAFERRRRARAHDIARFRFVGADRLNRHALETRIVDEQLANFFGTDGLVEVHRYRRTTFKARSPVWANDKRQYETDEREQKDTDHHGFAMRNELNIRIWFDNCKLSHVSNLLNRQFFVVDTNFELENRTGDIECRVDRRNNTE